MFEKRRHPRQPVSLEVVVHFAGKTIRGTTQDLSVGGAFLVVDESLPFGSEVEVEANLPGMGETRVPAVVRWTRSDGMGVQFGLLGARHTHALTELLAHTPKE